MKAVKQVLVTFAAFALALNVRAAWVSSVTEGWYDNASNWANSILPAWSNATTMCQWWFSTATPTDFIIRLPDFTPTPDYMMNMIQNDVSITFDGEDAVFDYAAIPDCTSTSRGNIPVFYSCWYATGGGNRYWAFEMDKSNLLGDAFVWSNVLFKTSHTNDGQIATLEFKRGTFDFASPNRSDTLKKMAIAGGEFLGRVIADFSGTEVYLPNLDFTAAATNSTFAIKGGRFETTGNTYVFNSAKVAVAGTNDWTVSDGAKVAIGTVKGADADFRIGYWDVPWRRNTVDIRGEGTEVDASRSKGLAVYGNTAITLANGARMTVRGASVGSKAGDDIVIDMSGDATELVVSTNAAGGPTSLSLGAADGARVVFNMHGGTIRGVEGCANNWGLNVGYTSGGYGEFNLYDGLVTMLGQAVTVGYQASGVINVYGGEILTDKGFNLDGRTCGTGVATNALNMYGGYVWSGAGFAGCAGTSDPNMRTFFNLYGGTNKCMRISGGHSRAHGEQGESYLTADGGTVMAQQIANNVTYPFFYDFDVAALGPKGLVIYTDYEVLMPQDFSDIEGQTGRLIVRGTGKTRLKSAHSTQSELVVDGGWVNMEPEVATYASHVIVTNGGRLTLTAMTNDLRVAGLTLGADENDLVTVELKPTTRIWTSAVQVNAAMLALSGTFEPNVTYPFIAVSGHPSAAQTAGWKDMRIASGALSGYLVNFAVTYDEEQDTTFLTLTFEEGAEPSVENVWQGSASGENVSWDDRDSWSAGVPDRTSVATFGEGDMARTVTIPSVGSEAGYLAFTGSGDYTLAGQGSLSFPDTGFAAQINVAGGKQAIEVPLKSSQSLKISVATGGELDLGEAVRVLNGKLVVNAGRENGWVAFGGTGSSFFGGVIFAGGCMELATAEAFDESVAVTPFTFTARGGTLWVHGDPSEPEYVLPFNFYISSSAIADFNVSGGTWGQAVCIRNDRTLVIGPHRTDLVAGECIVKRGLAPLVFESETGKSIRIGQVNGRFGNDDKISLPTKALAIGSDQIVPNDKCYGGFNVLEGEVVLRGRDDVTPTSASQAFLNTNGGLHIGLWSTNDVAVAPGIVVDHAYLDLTMNNNYYSYLAANAYRDEFRGEAVHAYLMATNGAVLGVGNLRVGPIGDAAKAAEDVYPCVSLYGSTYQSGGGTLLSARPGCHAIWTAKDGSQLFTGPSTQWNGDLDLTLDGGSKWSGLASTDAPLKLSLGATATGTALVTGGSTLRCSGVTATGTLAADAVTLAFDNGSLDIGGADGAFALPTGCGLKALAGGLRIDVPDGETWTLGSSVSGEGAVLLHGAGTLAIDGTITAAFGGTGTVSGGTLEKSRIRLDYEDGAIAETPNFAGTVFTGRTKVDFGRSEGDTIDASLLVGKTVARYKGTAPDVSTWKLTGTGYPHPYAKFVAAEGEVKIAEAANEMGLMVIVR